MIERVDMADLGVADFVTQYGVPGRPVLLKGLFSGQPIAEINSREAVIERLGSTELNCVDQQSVQFRLALEDFFEGRSSERGALDPDKHRFESVRDYLEPVDPNPPDLPTTQCRPAKPYQLHGRMSQEVAELFRVPDYCSNELYPWCRKDGRDSMSPLARQKLIFLARRGHYADLHNHRDLHHIFLHQVFGRKKAVLFPPQAANKLAPALYLSNIALNTLSPSELEHLVQYATGAVGIMQPGDTLFLPAGWWHYFEYIDDAMSINMRFAEPNDDDLQFLIGASQDHRVKRLAFELRDPRMLEMYRPELKRLRSIGGRRRFSAQARYKEFISEVNELLLRILPNEPRAHVDWNDAALSCFNSRGALGIGHTRHRAIDIMRRVGYRLAQLA